MRLLHSMLRCPRILAPLALLVALLNGCSGTTTIVVRPTATRAPIEETFIATSIAVIVPAPARPGDSVTVVIKPIPAYQPGSPQYDIQFTAGLYGPFPSLSSEQTAITTSTVGPPTWQSLISGLGGGGSGNGGDRLDQATSELPANLARGFYDLAVTLTLSGSRATARSDTVVRVSSSYLLMSAKGNKPEGCQHHDQDHDSDEMQTARFGVEGGWMRYLALK